MSTITIDRESFKTGIPIIDQQHEEYLDMVERLYRVCMHRPSRLVHAEAEMHNVIEYAIQHFDTEEQLMQSVDYPFYEEHLAKHNLFRNRTDYFYRELNTRGLSDVFVTCLTRWLLDWVRLQIQTDDMKLARYLKLQNPKWGTEAPPKANRHQP